MTRAADRGDGRLGHDEGLAVAVVEADGQVPGELEVLALVVAHRDPLGVVEQDVGRHEHGIGEQPGPHRLLLAALVLELGHPAQLPEGGGALEQPRQPGVLGDVALDEQGAHRRGRARRPAGWSAVSRVAAGQEGGVVVEGQGVEVDDAEEGVVVVLVGDPVAERPQVVAEVEVTARLHPRQDPGHGVPWYGTAPDARCCRGACAAGVPHRAASVLLKAMHRQRRGSR